MQQDRWLLKPARKPRESVAILGENDNWLTNSTKQSEEDANFGLRQLRERRTVGYGLEQPRAERPDGTLNALSLTLESSRECGGRAEADFLCGRSVSGSACHGDSGSGLTGDLGGTRTRIAEVLNRKRGPSIAMIRRLHERLGISADVLIRPS